MSPLPVLVEVYDGRLGGSKRPVHPVGIIKISQDLRQLLTALSLHYMVNYLGLLLTQETPAKGSSNPGLLDQSLIPQ